MKHLYLLLPLVLSLSITSCTSPKNPEKKPSDKQISIATDYKAVETNVAATQVQGGDEPATLADVERYYDVMQMRDQMKQLTTIMSHQTKQMMHEAMQNQPELPPGAEERINALYEKILKDMPTEELLQSMAPIYAKHFTTNDINAIIAFYSSPVGKKMVSETPAIAQEAMQASLGTMQKYMKGSMDDLNTLLQQIQQEETKNEEATSPQSEHLEHAQQLDHAETLEHAKPLEHAETLEHAEQK